MYFGVTFMPVTGQKLNTYILRLFDITPAHVSLNLRLNTFHADGDV